MTENQIRKKAKKIFEKNNWPYWFPPKVKYHQTDIFGIGDVAVVKDGIFTLIQLTTWENWRARLKKIKKVLESISMSCPIEIWAWDKKRKEFIRIKIGNLTNENRKKICQKI